MGKVVQSSRDLTPADRKAFDRMIRCRPNLCRICNVGDLFDLQGLVVLHAGPAIEDSSNLSEPLANAVVVAILFEGWASDQSTARRLLKDGRIILKAAQDFGAVTPLAAVISPSMLVLVVEDLEKIGKPIVTPLNGGARNALRFGIANRPTLENIRWLNSHLGPAMAAAIDKPIDLLELAARALDAGDDCHGLTTEGTKLLGRALSQERGWKILGGQVTRFMSVAESFFLNVWMAASRCILSAAEDISGSSLVVGMGGNGHHFGIRLAHEPRKWTSTLSSPPLGPWQDSSDLSALGAIGDSAVIEGLGLGAMSWLQRERIPMEMKKFLPVNKLDIIRNLLVGRHEKLQSNIGLIARDIVKAGVSIPISLGVLDRKGEGGLAGRGIYFPPMTLFESAIDHQYDQNGGKTSI